MISMKLNYEGYGNNKIHHNYDGDSNNKIHHDYYSCINDFLANHNDTTSMTLKIPILHNDHANANVHGHTNRNENTTILPSDNIEEVVRVLDQYFDTTDGISYECKSSSHSTTTTTNYYHYYNHHCHYYYYHYY
jgi:hypothetical protein